MSSWSVYFVSKPRNHPIIESQFDHHLVSPGLLRNLHLTVTEGFFHLDQANAHKEIALESANRTFTFLQATDMFKCVCVMG